MMRKKSHVNDIHFSNYYEHITKNCIKLNIIINQLYCCCAPAPAFSIENVTTPIKIYTH